MDTHRTFRTRRPRGLLVLVAVLALALASCAGGGGGLPDDPQAAVAAAFENRFAEGATVTASLQLTDAARQQLSGQDTPPAVLDALTSEDALSLTRVGGETAFSVAVGDGRPIQVRALESAFYLLIDVPALTEAAGADVSPEELQSQVGQASMLLGELSSLVDAALNGRWAGITEIPDDAGQQLQEVFGGIAGPTPDPTEAAELASELGFGSPSAFAERYLQVQEGDGGTYTATLNLRELVRASAQSAQQLAPGGAAPEIEDLQDVPEQLEGVTVETEGEQVTSLEADIIRLARSAGEAADTEGLSEGDVVLQVSFSEPDSEQLQAPEDAETVTFEDALGVLEQFAGMLEGFGQGFSGGTGSGGTGGTGPTEMPTDLPTGLPDELPTDLPDELPTDFEIPTPAAG